MAQRLVRAKKTIAEKRLPYLEPPPEELHDRLRPVLQVVLLLFNEGHTATGGEALTRVDLMEEAIRLGAMLTRLLPDEPEVRGLLALMQLNAARAASRVGAAGELVLLEAQDRGRWDASLIAQGLAQLQLAASLGDPGPFQIQAHIAAAHATAKSWDDTDWAKISHLYQALELLTPSPVLRLNRAVAVALAVGPAEGLRLIDEKTAKALENYHLLAATRGDLLRRLGRFDEAAVQYREAILRTGNHAERRFLEGRLEDCTRHRNSRSPKLDNPVS